MMSSSSILGVFSDVFLWVIVFALPVVAMTLLHMYLSMRKGSVEYGYLAGIGLFLLLELALEGGIQLLPTMIFMVLLYPTVIRTFISTIKDGAKGMEDDSTATAGAMVKIFTDSCSGAVNGKSDSKGGVDVLLINRHGVVMGVSALRVNPATSMVQPQSCVSLLTTLSKFHQQQDERGVVEWIFKVGVDPQDGGGVDCKFMVVADGKLKKGKEDEGEGHVVDLLKTATLYLRSALRSVGLIEEEEVSTIRAIELAKAMDEKSNDSGFVGNTNDEERNSSFDVVAVRGLPEKLITLEDGGTKLLVRTSHGSYSNSSSSVDFPMLLHPVGRLVRLMVADNVTGSFVVHFKEAKPPEGITLIDSEMVNATAASEGLGGDARIRFAGARRLPLNILMRSSVAGRLRIDDREGLAEEAISGVRRGYWNVGAYVAIKKEADKHADEDGDSTSPSAAAVKVGSALISCFSGGARSVDAKIVGNEVGGDYLTGDAILMPVDHHFERGVFPVVSTGEMSSDSLASFITLAPPYPVPGCDASSLAEFEIPLGGGNGAGRGSGSGNGLLNIGRAYFRGTPVGDVKIKVQDLSMHLAVLGETGIGKTRFVADLLRQLWDLDPTINWLIVDLKGEYYDQLQQHIGERIEVLRAEGEVNAICHGGGGAGVPLRIDLLNDDHLSDEHDESVQSERTGRLFSALKESLAGLFKENTELSPMMERILYESLKQVMTTAGNHSESTDKNSSGSGFFDALFHEVEKYVNLHKRRDIVMSGEALKNRLERFRRGAIGDILNYNYRNDKVKGYFPSPDFREMIRTKKVIIDLSGCVRKGCSKEDIRLLLNLITSVIFEEALKRGLVGAPVLRHLTVIEEANLLVPDVLRRKTMGDLTSTEDMILTARGFGEGLILVAQRPTISSFVLANAGTKVVFRSPYDATRVAEFMGFNEEQQNAVKSLRKFEAVVTAIQGGPYKISTVKPQQISGPTQQAGHRQHQPTQAPVSTLSSLLPPVASTPAVIKATEDEDASLEDDDDSGNGGHDSFLVDEGDVKRLLKKSSSGKLRLFKKIASSSQAEIGVSDVIRGAFGGDRWGYLDALRSLTDVTVWRKPLVAVVEENATLRLTEYGREVWRAIQLDATKRRRRGTDG